MNVPIIDPVRCDNSPACPAMRRCPTRALHQENGKQVIDAEKCTACGACVQLCPRGAIRMP